MKTFRLSIFLMAFCFLGGFAQTESGNNTDEEIINSEQESLNLLSAIIGPDANQEQNSNYFQAGNANDAYNSVMIQQVGDYNYVQSSTRSQSSNLELTQLGNNNGINLNVNAPDIQTNILQQGDNNLVNDIIYSTGLDVQLNVIQNGDNLQFNRIGVNALTNKIKFIQEGSFKTITLISN